MQDLGSRPLHSLIVQASKPLGLTLYEVGWVKGEALNCAKLMGVVGGHGIEGH
jgi:hypothetical protein